MANLNCFASFGDDDQNPVREGVVGALENKVGALFSLLWDMSLGGMTNLLLLHRNARRLDEEMTRLEELRDDLRGRALSEAAARSQAEITRQVGGWLDRVADLRSKVEQFQADLERQSICIAGLCLAFGAADNLRRAQALARQGLGFGSVTGAADPGADALFAEMDDLTVLRNDLMRRVEAEEAADPQARRTNVVESWVKKVDVLLWSPDAASSRTTAAVVEMLAQVRNLKARGDDLQLGAAVVSRLPPDSVQEVPSIPSSSVVGGEAALSEVRRHVEDESAGIIGVYGMGGVGKTTLVKKLNNDLLRPEARGMFDVVALVTVSRRPNILSLQHGIGKRMGLSFTEGFSGPHSTRREGDQARVLFRALSRKRFLLLLDDVWKKLDLGAVGIPHPGDRKGCKIVFTTRSAEVCDDMDADRRVRVEPLDEAHSWRLFCSKMGANEAVDDEPSVRRLAKEVVRRCGGLPLALITVGRAMAGRKLPDEWKHAIQSLDDSATELRGMESVLSSLKFSFDELEDDTLRSCLLYCALFHNEVPRNRLVEYWIGEGLLDGGDGDINRARNRGHFVISRLRDACLLEPREALIWGEAVGLHDAVLDMALWLTGDRFGDCNVFLALAGRCEVPPTRYWEDARRISLVENTTQVDFAAPPNCPNLSTLLLSSSRFGRSATGGFFGHMPLLSVLALSTTDIRDVPGEIGLLVQLRFLDLSNTRIRALPEELGKLTRLRQLFLAFTFELRRIPREAITGLTSLQQLDMYESDYQWDGDAEDRSAEDRSEQLQLGLRDLELLPRLRNLSIMLFRDRSSRQVFTGSCFLLRSTTHLAIRLSQGFDAAKSRLVQIRHLFLADEEGGCARGLQFGPGDLPSLLNLILLGFNYSPISVRLGPGGDLPLRSLQALRVDQCNLVEDLTWAGQLPCLRELEVNRCDSMGELLKVAGEGEDEGYDTVSFPRLKSMILNELKSLTCISKRMLLLPQLEELKVRGCPELKRLPLGHRSAPKMAKITAEREWWDGLTWDAQIGEGSSAVSRFLPYLEIVVPPAEEGGAEWEDGEDVEPERGDLDLLRDLLDEDELDWDDSQDEDEDEEDDPMDEDMDEDT